MIKRFFELQEKVSSYYKNANTELLKKAYSVAASAHMNQRRATNEPYIIHPLAVAATLADMHLDEISIAAGLLHDIIEDTDYTIEDITEQFGKEIGDLVWGVTKISKISDIDTDSARAETLKKMIIAMTNDVRVILIKLADRIHNVRTLDALPEGKRVRIARETLEIYAPIAYRLGMGKIKDELENISFRYAYPEEYEQIRRELEGKKEWVMSQLLNVKKEITAILKKLNVKGEIQNRIKREISIYRKIKRQNISLDMVYDLIALRIITSSVANCYAILSEILQNKNWQSIPSKWSDFISNPKSNGYQSIHTTLFTREGTKFEIQIRTKEMHRIAEEGIAAHWKYKEGISSIGDDHRLQWFRDLIDTHKSNPDPQEFLSMVKRDLRPAEIYVFTPKGKVINLRVGATPIDFAYAVHTEIGNRCKGAIVNEHLVPLRTVLKSGDTVEILTSKNSSPSADWLKYVVTNKARKNIAGFIQKREHNLNVEKGRRTWARILREYKKKHRIKFSEEDLLGKVKKLHYNDVETFNRDIGSGKRLLDKKTLSTLFPELDTEEIEPIRRIPKKTSQAYKLVNVEGYQDIDIVFARCCNPIKGADIVGYMTQKRGLVVHRKECASLKNVLPSRLKAVKWNKAEDYVFMARYDLIVSDKPGILSTISKITAEASSNIKKLSSENISQNMSRIRLTFEVKDVAQLKKIYKGFKTTKGIYSVIRRRISGN
jgi:GTP pyrophosphokinase